MTCAAVPLLLVIVSGARVRSIHEEKRRATGQVTLVCGLVVYGVVSDFSRTQGFNPPSHQSKSPIGGLWFLLNGICAFVPIFRLSRP